MKKKPNRARPLLRWGKVLLLATPLLFSCAKSSSAEASASSETASEGTLVATNSAGGDKDAKKDADMKEVILNVFGMT